jgi:hypothetical protein
MINANQTQQNQLRIAQNSVSFHFPELSKASLYIGVNINNNHKNSPKTQTQNQQPTQQPTTNKAKNKEQRTT